MPSRRGFCGSSGSGWLLRWRRDTAPKQPLLPSTRSGLASRPRDCESSAWRRDLGKRESRDRSEVGKARPAVVVQNAARCRARAAVLKEEILMRRKTALLALAVSLCTLAAQA